MPQDFYPELVRRLRAAGFERVADTGKGSHERWMNGRLTVTVARTKSRHTANSILKKAGLPKTF